MGLRERLAGFFTDAEAVETLKISQAVQTNYLDALSPKTPPVEEIHTQDNSPHNPGVLKRIDAFIADGYREIPNLLFGTEKAKKDSDFKDLKPEEPYIIDFTKD